MWAFLGYLMTLRFSLNHAHWARERFFWKFHTRFVNSKLGNYKRYISVPETTLQSTQNEEKSSNKPKKVVKNSNSKIVSDSIKAHQTRKFIRPLTK